MKRDVVGNGGLINEDGQGNWDEAEVKVGNVQLFDQLGSTPSQGMMEVNLHLGLSYESSSSSSSLIPTALDREKFDRDLQNKRPKVHSFSLMNDKGNDSIISTVEDFEVQMDLTDDLLHMVFSFLDRIDLCRASSVCRQWREVGSHEDFWRYLNFENRPITLQQFKDMCHRYPNATAVNIYNTPKIHWLVMKAISSLRNLEVLTVGEGQLYETFFEALADCHLLRSLTIKDTTLGNGIQEIPIYHDRLRLLQVVKCDVLCISIRCPQLETLSLKCSRMQHVVLNCPLLHDLDIASCYTLSDAAILSAAASCPLLESLDMSHSLSVIDETLREIALTCRNLRIVDASYCPNLSLESLRLPMLTVLKLHSREGITSASMAFRTLSRFFRRSPCLVVLRENRFRWPLLQR